MMVLILFSEDSGLRVGLLFLALYHSVLAFFFFLPSDVGPYQSAHGLQVQRSDRQ